MEMEALILTKSGMFKNGNKGACVTAHNPQNNCFVRFVADMQGSPIPYYISNRFSTLDYVSVSVIAPCKDGPQTENLLVNTYSFSVVKQYPREVIGEIYQMLPSPPFPRFMDTSGYRLSSVEAYDHSLELVRVSELQIRNESGKGKASFRLVDNQRSECNYSVTDPLFDIRKSNRKTWDIGDAYVVISIPTEPYVKDGKSYGYFKFIAAIYPIS